MPYHHGNLAEALVDAGFVLAKDGGPVAVTVREAARRVGVSAPAAYRHFADRDDFLAAVARRCRQELAATMIAARARHRTAWRRFESVGRAYIDLAIDQPHLIETAFAAGVDGQPDDPDALTVLTETLDELVDAGLVTPERRNGAEIVAWAAVHGIATLLARSPAAAGYANASAERVLLGVWHALGVDANAKTRPRA